MTSEQIQTLQKQDTETLCNWYCLLNTWRWPAELHGDPYPNISDSSERMKILSNDSNRVTSKIMEWIRNKIGNKVILKYWNVNFCHTMNEEDFEKWYSETFKKD